jgi:hypothetical protein
MDAKTIKEIFNVKPDFQHQFNKYIEDSDRLLDYLQSSDTLNIIAPPNSGKTYSIIKLCLEYKIKAIITVPLQIIASQSYEHFKASCTRNEIGLVQGSIVDEEGTVIQKSKTNTEIQEMLSNPKLIVVLCVYDSIPRLLYNDKLDKFKKYCLIIDEAHNLVTQFSFRSKAILGVISNVKYFKNFIYITGTPEGVLLKGKYTVRFCKEQQQKQNKVNVICRIPKKYLEVSVYNHICHKSWANQVVVIYDDINALKRLEHAILNSDRGKVFLLNASRKNYDEYTSIVKKEKIPNDIKFLLTTRVISDGMNIKNENVSALYMLDINDLILKRQIIGRFRTNNCNIKIYDLISCGDNKARNLIDLNKEHERHIEAVEKEIDENNVLFRLNLETADTKGGVYNYYCDNKKRKLFVFEERIRYYLLNDIFNNIIPNRPELIESYYKDIAHFNTSIIEFTEFAKKYLQDREATRKDYFSKVNKPVKLNPELTNDIITNFHKYTTAYILIKRQDLAMGEFFDHDLINKFFDYEAFYNTNRCIMTERGGVDNLMKELIPFIQQGFPDIFIRSLVELKLKIKPNIQLKTFYKSCQYFLLAQKTIELRTNSCWFDEINIRINDIARIVFIIDNFKVGSPFSYQSAQISYREFIKKSFCEDIPPNDRSFSQLLTSIFDFQLKDICLKNQDHCQCEKESGSDKIRKIKRCRNIPKYISLEEFTKQNNIHIIDSYYGVLRNDFRKLINRTFSKEMEIVLNRQSENNLYNEEEERKYYTQSHLVTNIN